MIPIRRIYDQAGAHDYQATRLVLLLLGGLLIGLAASLPLVVAWPDAMRPPVGVCLFGTETNPMERIWFKGIILPLPCMPTFLFIQPVVWGCFLGAALVFGLIACELAEPTPARSAKLLIPVLGAFCFLIMTFLGSWVVPRLSVPELPLPFSSAIAGPFALMVFGISFPFALVIGLALRTPGFLWRALVAAALTALCYWFVAWLLQGRAVMIWSHDPAMPSLGASLPDLGNGMGLMMKTVVIGNLISGTIGGWVTLALLTVSRSKK